jgi:ABC-type polar amino acid transport system ATPase subunit
MFDLPARRAVAHARFDVELPDAGDDWTIGLIVGPSGSGKSSVAREAFGKALWPGRSAWPNRRAVIEVLADAFGSANATNDAADRAARLMTAVGFSTAPSWLRPYATLSNGEQFRCELARALASSADAEGLVVFDEFTSVVDRQVARACSMAVGKLIRRGHAAARRFVAVTCHYDVARWLSPDWVLDMASGELARGRLRRPRIHLRVDRCERSLWGKLFAPHHYLDGDLHGAAQCYAASYCGKPIAFCATLPTAGWKGRDRITRIVTLPDWQGIGVGTRLLRVVAQHRRSLGRRVSIVTSHPAMIASLNRSADWKLKYFAPRGNNFRDDLPGGGHMGTSAGRGVHSFEFVGRAA